MRWRTKALIQTCVGWLPDRISFPLYFRLQRHFGNLRRSRIDPTSRLVFGMEICRQIVAQGRSPRGADFMEVGTGWRLNLPIACWLCGARRIWTVDPNPYLRFSLIREDVEFIQHHPVRLWSRLRREYGELLDVTRWRQLIDHRPTSIQALSALCGIEYESPVDARCTNATSHSIDFHVSCNVFEHISPDDLRRILMEANRLMRPNGLLIHRVDHTDHFSHTDTALSPIKFLHYTDAQWRRYAKNRYGYVNRLREDDYIRLFQECGQRVCAVYSEPDEGARQLLGRGFALDARFRCKSVDTLSRLTSLFVVAPKSASHAADRAA